MSKAWAMSARTKPNRPSDTANNFYKKLRPCYLFSYRIAFHRFEIETVMHE